ncbi:MAG: hypothetical protein ACD_79C00878G0002 [uncultured bacterium]|nr:MAG: hypothetical protein ACD_79C00878G0002 [uncultured bacterium]
MIEIKWNLLKNELLKKTRGVSFDELLNSKLIGIKKHPAKENQKIMLFEYKNYIWVVPYVTTNEGVFLKTLFPSRKYTKIYNEVLLK